MVNHVVAPPCVKLHMELSPAVYICHEFQFIGIDDSFIIIIDREAREIMHLVASVCPSVCPSVCLGLLRVHSDF